MICFRQFIGYQNLCNNTKFLVFVNNLVLYNLYLSHSRCLINCWSCKIELTNLQFLTVHGRFSSLKHSENYLLIFIITILIHLSFSTLTQKLILNCQGIKSGAGMECRVGVCWYKFIVAPTLEFENLKENTGIAWIRKI